MLPSVLSGYIRWHEITGVRPQRQFEAVILTIFALAHLRISTRIPLQGLFQILRFFKLLARF